AEAVKSGPVRISSVYTDGTPGRCTNIVIMRATGGDVLRFVESSQVALDRLTTSGTLDLPSFEPEYRSDNTLLYVSTSSWTASMEMPTMAITGAAPILTESLSAVASAEGMDGLSTTLSSRSLTSA